jgi:uncharacterized protein (DUF433 family)
MIVGMETILGKGVYDIAEVAKLTGLSAARIREWFRGKRTAAGPLFTSDYAVVNKRLAVSFHDLVDVFIAGQLREHGVPLQTLRKVYKQLQIEFGTPHPFCRNELIATDGKRVFTAGLDRHGREQIVEILGRQRVFPEVIRPFLKKIDYDHATKLALKWRITKQIVVDPEICFGQPIVEEVGIPTAILAAAYAGNRRDPEAVADWYGIKPAHVLAAVEFESRLAG